MRRELSAASKMKSFLKKAFHKNIPPKPADGVYVCSRDDYDSTFAIPKTILYWITVKLTHDITPSTRKFWVCNGVFEFLNIFMAVCLQSTSMVLNAQGGSFEDVVKIFSNLPCVGMSVLGLIKAYSMFYHEDVYENLVNELGDMWDGRKVNEKEWTVLNEGKKQLMFVTKGFYWCNNAMIFNFLWPASFESLKRLLGYDNETLLHFNYWLPFELTPFFIEILLIIQLWHTIVTIWMNMAADLLFYAYLSHITIQFDVLALKIQSFIYVPIDKQLINVYPLSEHSKEHMKEKSHLNSDWEEKLEEELGDIIQTHTALIKLSKDVEFLYTFQMFVSFFNSSMVICFCGFCSVVVEKWNDTAYKSFLVTSLSQTFLICWYGQKLLDSSLRVSNAIYNSGWYNGTRKIKKALIIMLHRSQKPIQVTTCGFSVVSLASYTQIIKTAWSYFTLLMNTYNQ